MTMQISKSDNPTETLPKSPTFSSLYNDEDANVTFISSDGIGFKMHSKYFSAVSAGFSAPESDYMATEQQPVVLTEPAKVLELLFQFMHPPSGSESQHFHQPSVLTMDTALFFDLATAAEKYIVYAAMNACLIRMHYELYSSKPIQVLNHSANHGYPDLADKAAPETMALSNPLQDTLNGLTDPKVAVKWMKYYGHWLEVPKVVSGLSSATYCPRYAELLFGFLRSLASNPTKIHVELPPPKTPCNTNAATCNCKRFNETYIKGLLDIKIKTIPKFSQIK